jgi:hypothetical protein
MQRQVGAGGTALDSTTLRRVTAGAGMASGALTLAVVPLYFVYSGPPPVANVLTRNLLNVLTCAAVLVFLVGIRHLVARADRDLDPVAGVFLAAGLLHVAGTLVATSLEAGAVLQNPQGTVDPTVDGPLAHAAMLLHGSIGRLLTAVALAAIGYAVARTRVMPAAIATAAYAVAAVNLVFVPSLFFGTDAAQFYSAVGWGNTAMTAALFPIWSLAAGATLLRTPPATPADRRPRVEAGRGGGATR